MPERDPACALPVSFYERPAEDVARALLGCVLVSRRPVGLAAGVIVEAEAYGGLDDPASHAAFRRNGHVRLMWGPGGRVYVYRAYGVYPCFNVVTGREGTAEAVLIRALEPVAGLDVMVTRVGAQPESRLASGPGKLSLALGITLDDNGLPLDRSPLWIEPGEAPASIAVGPRVGVRRAADRPLRFGVAGHPSLSRRFQTAN